MKPPIKHSAILAARRVIYAALYGLPPVNSDSFATLKTFA
jgi:hypothetical protein